MNPDYNEIILRNREIILRNKLYREPMSNERLKLILNYTMYIIAEILGFGLAFVFLCGMFGVLK